MPHERYDPNNIFARILRKEIVCDKVFENDHVLAFHDKFPKKKTHVLVIPKGEYVSFADFSDRADPQEISAFFQAVGAIARDLGLEGSGYRLIANTGAEGGQEVPHFHVHIIGGEPVGPMVCA